MFIRRVMNIFVLDADPKICARYHGNRHVTKMILESAQILSTVIQHHWDIEPVNKLYKPTHYNHPCTLWARSCENFYWLIKLGVALGEEYTYRYGKIHKSVEVIENASEYINSKKLESTEPEYFVMAMPDEYKSDHVVQSYRSYYLGEKSHLLNYKNRTKPEWIYDTTNI